MIVINPRPSPIGIIGKIGMPFFQAGELDRMTGLTLGIGKLFQIESASMMFLMTGDAGHLRRVRIEPVDSTADLEYGDYFLTEPAAF